MKKVKELCKAFGYVPTMFKLIYNTDKRYLFYLIIETLCFALLPYPSVFLIKYSLDALDNHTLFSEYTIVCILLILLQFFISALKSKFNNLRPARTSLVIGRLYNDFHRHSMEMDYELLAEKETQELQVKAGEFIKRRLANTVWNFVSLFSGIISFVFSFVLLFDANAFVTLVVFLSLIVDSAITMKYVSLNIVLDENIISNNRYINYYESKITDERAAKDIRIYDMGDKIRSKIEQHNTLKFEYLKKKKKLNNIRGIFSAIITHGIDILLFVFLGYLVLNEEMSVGSFSLAISNAALFRTRYSGISSTLTGYSETAKYIEYYNKFIAIESKFRKTGTKHITLTKNDSFIIEFRNVSFKYPGQTEYALENFSIIINSHEKYSIIGENGAGKSTFVKLLMRLYDPTEGIILLNGIDIKQYNYDDYLSLFAPVFQDYKLFAFTIDENISSFSDDNIDKLRFSAKKAGIDKRIMQLPKQYKTYFTKQFDDDGVDFSGGEQQKIAIARSYYRNDAIITILDEPTSALDPRAERKIYENLNDLIGDNTAFYISHRLASSRFCDKIIVIKDRHLCEFGSHNELICKKGYYMELYNLQADYYK